MVRKYLLPGLLVVAFVTPAAAATEYYVAKGGTTKKCSVTTKKPDGTKMMMIGTMSYKTKPEATKAMKAAADCK